MTKIWFWVLDSDVNSYRKAITAFRNLGIWAKEKRDGSIAEANKVSEPYIPSNDSPPQSQNHDTTSAHQSHHGVHDGDVSFGSDKEEGESEEAELDGRPPHSSNTRHPNLPNLAIEVLIHKQSATTSTHTSGITLSAVRATVTLRQSHRTNVVTNWVTRRQKP